MDYKTLPVDLADTGRATRLDALACYLRALPVDTQNHWEFLICVLYDLDAILTERGR